MEKQTMWFPNRFDTNRAVQAQNMARSLEFRIKKVEEFYNPRIENNALICIFVFSYVFALVCS